MSFPFLSLYFPPISLLPSVTSMLLLYISIQILLIPFLCLFQNFASQMASGFDEKSGGAQMGVMQGPMVSERWDLLPLPSCVLLQSAAYVSAWMLQSWSGSGPRTNNNTHCLMKTWVTDLCWKRLDPNRTFTSSNNYCRTCGYQMWKLQNRHHHLYQESRYP